MIHLTDACTADAPRAAPNRDQEMPVHQDIRQRECLLPDAAILVAGSIVVPLLRMPAQAWGLRVLAVDTAADTDEVALFAAQPMAEAPEPRCHDGDVVVQLRAPATNINEQLRARTVDVHLLVARQGRWQQAGNWPDLEGTWPRVTAPTIARLMQLTDAPDQAHRGPVERTGCLQSLVIVGALREGEGLLCPRPTTGEYHEATVHNGGIRFPDGRWFATPSAAMTALGYPHQSGWQAWRRARDGARLNALRTQHALAPSRRERIVRHLAPLLDNGILRPGDELRCVRPVKGTTHTARVTSDGYLKLEDGTCHRHPTAAITAATEGGTADGWNAWRRTSDGRTLDELYNAMDTQQHRRS
ncbi:hypothetical protein M8C13_05435 [Crossiella sp. SN42]|uniref:restriction system modified-DNA reader domain-containing protein n=1 Tax=Crossiella sp. SN42 TaxID=2944808 RepID=UPI00207D532C|nr:hypothetical protein [Crossiella sp. SN42]MCO1575201.1 hypothetical protein [Crossiella sp. SN42]